MAKTPLPETCHRCHSKGHEGCWDGIHTFERCCGVQEEMSFASSMDEFVLLISRGFRALNSLNEQVELVPFWVPQDCWNSDFDHEKCCDLVKGDSGDEVGLWDF